MWLFVLAEMMVVAHVLADVVGHEDAVTKLAVSSDVISARADSRVNFFDAANLLAETEPASPNRSNRMEIQSFIFSD